MSKKYNQFPKIWACNHKIIKFTSNKLNLYYRTMGKKNKQTKKQDLVLSKI